MSSSTQICTVGEMTRAERIEERLAALEDRVDELEQRRHSARQVGVPIAVPAWMGDGEDQQ